jgi:hypothetical protein
VSVEDSIKEIQKGLTGLDKMIPPKEEVPKYHYNHFNYTLPQPVIKFEWPGGEINYGDIIASIGLVLGFIALGMAIKGI